MKRRDEVRHTIQGTAWVRHGSSKKSCLYSLEILREKEKRWEKAY